MKSSLMKFFLSVIIFANGLFVLGQDISTSTSGVYTQCSGNFYDSGGSGADFSEYEDYTITISPSISGNKVQIVFNAWDFGLTTLDYLEIYDGNSSSAPLIGVYDGSSPVTLGSAILSTASDGSLTFVFHSSGLYNYPGWEATYSCVAVCQDVVAVLLSTLPVDASGYINICQGESVTFNGQGSYPDNGTLYTQSDATSTFTWVFSNGDANMTGSSITKTFNDGEGCDVNLVVNDTRGCDSDNDIGIRVRVSTTPIFNGTQTASSGVCVGETTNLVEVITPVEWSTPIDNTVAGTTFLPDGSGASYSTQITVNNFNSNQTVSSVTDISNICLNMEHSYIGDLDVYIQCPNGSRALLFDGTSATTRGAWLGVPVDDDADLSPGVGYDYCFTHDGPTNTLINDYAVTSSQSIAAGTYTPEDDFTSLIGCPLNGDWTIEVTDNVSQDNGYIFSWDIAFDPSLYTVWSYTPGPASPIDQTWAGQGVTSGFPSTATPTSGPTQTYTLTYVDEYNCSYDTSIVLTVNSGPLVDALADQSVCDSYTFPSITGTNISANAAYYTATGSGGTQYLEGSNFTSVGTQTIYIYDESGTTPNCSNEQSFQLTITATPSITGTLSACEGATSQLSGSGIPDGTTPWVSSDVSVATIDNTGLVTALTSGTTDITYLNDAGCSVTETFTVTFGSTISGTLSACVGATSQLSGSDTPDGTTPWVSSDLSIATVNSSGLVTAVSAGTSDITYLNSTGCSITQTFTVSATPSMTGTLALCVGSTTQLSGTDTPDGSTPWASSDVAVATIDNLGEVTALTSGTTDITYLTDAGCSVTEAVTVTALNTVALPSSTPTLCENTALTSITHATTGATGIGAATGLPAGVTASWSANVITISGTPTTSVGSPFSYSIPLTGGCGSVNATGTITVNAENTVSVASSNPTLCENTALTPITHSTTGATGIGTATGLPTGVTASFASDVISIIGTPVNVGSYSYSIPLTGGCGTISATGTIDVDARPSGISITTNCTGATLDNVTVTASVSSGTLEYSIDNSTWQSSNVFTTLSSGSTYSFYVRTVGTSCSSSLLNQIVNCNCSVVSDNTISADETICTGTAPSLLDGLASTVSPVIAFLYQWQESSDNSNWTDISGEVNEDYQPGTLTSSTYFRRLVKMPGCADDISNAVFITVNNNNTVGLASSSPTVCENSAITSITHSTTGATGISDDGVDGANGLPLGVSATWLSDVITISGTPTVAGSYTYSIPLTGGCGSVVATGTIQVDGLPTSISIATSCTGANLDNVTVNSSVSSGTLEYSIDNVSWQSSNVFTGISSGSTPTFYVRTVGTSCQSDNSLLVDCSCSVVTDNTISADETICTGSAPSLLDGITSTVAPVVAFTYQWQESSDNSNWIDISGEVNEDYQPGTLTTSTYYRRLVKMPGCADDISNAVFITVNNNNTVGLASSSPTVCENSAITSITHSTTGATGISDDGVDGVNGLPLGVSAKWLSDVITISGTPTVAGSYTYSIPLTGGCGSVVATGTIQVDGLPTAISIATSCTGANLDNVTVNSSVSSGTLEYSIDNVSWQSSNVFTGISSGSTPTFYVRTVGTSCQSDNSLLVDCSCSIVSDNTISADETICTGTAPSLLDGMTSTVAPVVAFTYQWQESLDNSNWTDISGEVNEDYQPGSLTSSSYYRRLVKMAGCGDDVSNVVTISITPNNSASTETSSPVCVNDALITIVHSTIGATGIVSDGVDGANGLPTGVSATWVSDEIMISGTPTLAGVYNYSIPLTGGCGSVNATGSITVNDLPTIAPLIGNTGCVGDLDLFTGTTDDPSTPWTSSDPSIADIDNLGFITSISPGTVDITYTDINGCSIIDQYTVYGNPIADAGIDQILTCSNTLIQLDGTNASNVVGDTYYQWYDQSAAQVGSLNPQVDISIPGTYYLGVVYMYDPINTLYCYAEDTIEITQDITTLNLEFLPISDLCENDLDIDLSLNVDIAGGTWSSSGIGSGNLPIFSPSTEGVNSYTVDYTVVNPVNDCPSTEQISFAVNPVPIIDISVDALDGCVPLSIALTDNNYSVGDVVNWNTDNKDYLNQSSFSHTYNIDGNYDITISKANSYGCISSATFVDTISVNPLPIASFELDNYELSTYNSKAVITNNSTDGEWYYWVFGDGVEDSTQVLDIEHFFPNDVGGDYIMRLIVKSSNNCFDTTYTKLKVNEELIYYIPNSFTPNGDNYNQEFKPVFTSGVDLDDYSLLIYNRWGELIFESHDMNIGWDGLFSNSDIEVNSDVFVWKIIFKTKDNENSVQEVGTLNLLK